MKSICLAFVFFCLTGSAVLAQPALPELPREYLDTGFVLPDGNRLLVKPDCQGLSDCFTDLQDALDAAVPGDVIELEAGATFVGNFVLPVKAASDSWIYLVSSALDQLPPPGERVSPEHAPHMPKIVTDNELAVLRTVFQSSRYRLTGIEISSSVDYLYSLIYTGLQWDGWDILYPDSSDQSPSDIVFDRCYVHGSPDRHVRIGINLNGNRMAVIDSFVSDIHYDGPDAIGIQSWNGAGPYKIVNNFIESAGINIMWGGDDPSIPDLVPADIEYRGNHSHKKIEWMGDPDWQYRIKNSFELKNAIRVLVEGNIFEYNWYDAQYGPSIVFTVRNQSGTAPWSRIDDITFRLNVVRNVAGGVNILPMDNNHPSEKTERILIENNLFYNVDRNFFGGGGGRFISVVSIEDTLLNLTVNHNTLIYRGQGNAFLRAGDAQVPAAASFLFNNNLVTHGDYGFHGNAGGSLEQWFPGLEFTKNAIIGRPVDREYGADLSGRFPADNFVVNDADLDAVGFTGTSLENPEDFRLLATSPYKNAASDGKDIGVDMDALVEAIACVESGSCEPDPEDGGPPDGGDNQDGGGPDPDAGSDPGSDPGSDAGSDPGSDPGGDPGSDDPGPGDQDDGCSCSSHQPGAGLLMLLLLVGLVRRRG